MGLILVRNFTRSQNLLVGFLIWLNQLTFKSCMCKLCARTFLTVFLMSNICTTSTSKFYCLFQSLEGRKRGSWDTFCHLILKGKNHSARSERQSPLIWVSGWGDGERRKNNCVTGNDVDWIIIESSSAKVEESNAFSPGLSFLYSLPSLALFCLAAKPS